MRKKARILLFQWEGSAYDSLGGILRLAGEELADDGHEVLTLVADRPGWMDELKALIKRARPHCAIGMSGVGSDLLVDGDRLLWEAARVPFFSWNCDHPAYFKKRHAIRSPYLLHGYVFPDHARYALRHLNANGVAVFAHLGIPPRRIFGDAPRPLRSRNGRIVFAKSGGDTNAIEARWRGFAPLLRDLLFAAAEELMTQSTSAHLPTLQRLAEGRGLLLDGDSLFALQMIRELDAYIRFRRAGLVLDAIRPYPVDVYGAGWDHVDWGAGAAAHRGRADWRAMIDLLPSYLGCVSTNPLVEQSVHDRSFFALAANVTPIADSNAFSRAHLPGLERYAFRFDAGSVAAAVEALLADPAAALEATETAWIGNAERFSLRASLRLILDAVKTASMNARVSP